MALSSDCAGGLRLGLCSVTFRHAAFAEILDLARSAGIEAIEWADAHVPGGDFERARAVGRATRDAGIEPISYGSYVQAGVTGASDFASSLATAQALGARNLRIWTARGVGSRDVPAALRERIVEDLRAFASAAESAGLTLSLEYHRETLTDTLESTVGLLDAVRHPNVFAYWQPRAGIETAEAAAEIETLHSRLTDVHVFHWNARRERFPLADAHRFWQPLLDRLAQVPSPSSRRRCAFIEFVAGDDPVVFARDARTLARWIR